MSRSYDVVVVGAGHGGAQACIALRAKGFQGSILMIGAEPELPYERPPLSKDYLAGTKPFQRMLIRPAGFWEEKQVAMELGNRVLGVAPQDRSLTLASGDPVRYGQLIWSAGADPRRLSCAGHDLGGVHTVRHKGDVDALADRLSDIRRVVIIGGGYIGLEAAAALRKLDKRITLVEAADRVLGRVAGSLLSHFYQDAHRKAGVDLRLRAKVDCLVADGDRVGGVRLDSGEVLACDAVIVGIGVVPHTRPLTDAGADGQNGVRVDADCRTSLPGIYAIGDCAEHENRYAGGAWLRLESVQNATDMAAVAASHITGSSRPCDAVPRFWSDQYDLRLQTVGLSTGYDQEVVRGDVASRSFSVGYFRDGRLVALDCVNAPRDFAQGRALVAAMPGIEPGFLADTANALKDLLPESGAQAG